ncbi:MAG: hypothetical protein OEW91_16200 [Acidimicrobiia bacterium]|nr:hypothetical protein [Acidimicrobiia bacterium]
MSPLCCLFVPGDRPYMLAAAATGGADALIVGCASSMLSHRRCG